MSDDVNKSYELLRIIKKVKGTIKQNIENQFGELKLTGPQGMLVGILAHTGEMRVSDVSEKMGLSNSTVSGIIDRLEIQGYVERTRSNEDRRVVWVNLTSDFRKKAEGSFKSFDTHFANIINNSTPEELDKILIGFRMLDELMTRNSNHNNCCKFNDSSTNKKE